MNYVPMFKNTISMNKNCIMGSNSITPIVQMEEPQTAEPKMQEGSGMRRNMHQYKSENPTTKKLNKFINLKI